MILLIFTFAFGVVFAQLDSCDDNNPQCVAWKQYCDDPMNKIYMEMNCKRTCGLCPKCEDQSWRCLHWKPYCTDRSRLGFMQKYCPLTCGFCTVPTTEPPPPVTPTWKVIPPGQCGKPTLSQGRVINGVNAKRGAWPWQVLIRYMGETHCGGSIIDPYWIVTAAHCIEGKEALKKEFKVVVGEHDFNVDEGSEVHIDVSKLIVHSAYSRMTLDYDIALIKLNRPIPFDQKYSGTVCLPSKNEAVPVGTKCFITGWGKVSAFGDMHHKLQQAALPIVEDSKCKALNTNNTRIPVTERMICAGHGPLEPTGGCHGDSGGPFVCQTGPKNTWMLYGAVSWGSGQCNTTEAYTVFAKISYLRDWIDNKLATE